MGPGGVLFLSGAGGLWTMPAAQALDLRDFDHGQGAERRP